MLDAQQTGTATDGGDQALTRFEALNADLELKTRALLNRIVADDRIHPLFINTLSMLEHMGSHKIMATQHGAAIDQPTLKHLAEESNHAFFMKRQAEKAAGRPLEYRHAELLVPESARMYFQRLEAGVLRVLGSEDSAPATYLYMSMLIEFRAVWFYSLYEQVLKRHAHSMSLKRLLGEERNHLTEMADRLEQDGELNDARVEQFLGTEHSLYTRLLDSLHRAVD